VTAAYYAFTYVGFAAPYLLARAAGAASYTLLLLFASGLAVVTAGSSDRAHGARAAKRSQTARRLSHRR
jgi:hypothetical protein